VDDKRGVLAQITRILADHDVSLEQVLQQPYNGGKQSEIILITHHASRRNIFEVRKQFEELTSISEVKSLYRVEGGEEK
jgi:homoserine dehydrogenase